MSTDPVVILGYARTPMGSFQGALSGATATELGAAAVKAAVDRAGVSAEAVERIYMGCVLPAGLGQAPARQAAIGAGLGTHVEATTVNKMCGSGMQAAIMGAEALAAGSVDMLVAGGMESMTNAPYLSKAHRSGARIGHDRLLDHMYLDGLEDAYEPGKLMGNFAEDTAADYQFTRAAMDDYAIRSLTRAQTAQASGAFDREIVPVEVKGRKGSTTVALDEQPAKGDIAKIPTLKPAFSRDGTITAANAWTGLNTLDDDQLRLLAKSIVAEIRTRVFLPHRSLYTSINHTATESYTIPLTFIGLAQFVNRYLCGYHYDTSLAGCLQTAIVRADVDGANLSNRTTTPAPIASTALLAASGQRSAALAQFETCRRILKEELEALTIKFFLTFQLLEKEGLVSDKKTLALSQRLVKEDRKTKTRRGSK